MLVEVWGRLLVPVERAVRKDGCRDEAARVEDFLIGVFLSKSSFRGKLYVEAVRRVALPGWLGSGWRLSRVAPPGLLFSAGCPFRIWDCGKLLFEKV